MLSSPPLFKSRKEFSLIVAILVFIITVRLIFIYQDYKRLKSLDDYYYTDAQVVKLYKGKYGSTLLRLKNPDGLEFYLFTHKKPPPKRFDWVRVKIRFKNDTSFIDYLRGFFAKGYLLEEIESGFNVKAFFKKLIDKQHKDENIRSFYYAIFLADPLNKELRSKITNLGISHLVAMSGFHLGILWMIIYAILYFPYKILQKRFFPWRHRNIDLGLITLTLLAIFVLFVGAPPSIVRAYFMLAIGWFVLMMGLRLVSFEFLLFALLLILLFFPKLIVSLGLLLSFSGVFYVFLVLKYFKEYPSWAVTTFFIPLALFVLMYPVGHYFFNSVTPWQLLSPILSVIFILFYPLSLLLHLFGLGWFFDKALMWLFELPSSATNIPIPDHLIVFYFVLSISSILHKKIFYALLTISTIVTTYQIVYSLFIS